MKKLLLVLSALSVGLVSQVGATVDDALSFAYEAATPYVDQGFSFREDAWGGDLGEGEQKAVAAQLFRGNEYWFCLGTATDGAVVTVNVYDSKGKLVGTNTWQRGRFAGTRVVPKQSGTFYAIVEVQRTPVERAHWALVYGYR